MGGDASLGYGVAQALLTAHYCVHGAFMQHDGQLVAGAARGALRHIPTIAVQGQEDLVCPPATAHALSVAWPEMHLRMVPRAGHSMYDPSITHELLEATDAMRSVCCVREAGGGGGGAKGRVRRVKVAQPQLAVAAA